MRACNCIRVFSTLLMARRTYADFLIGLGQTILVRNGNERYQRATKTLASAISPLSRESLVAAEVSCLSRVQQSFVNCNNQQWVQHPQQHGELPVILRTASSTGEYIRVGWTPDDWRSFVELKRWKTHRHVRVYWKIMYTPCRFFAFGVILWLTCCLLAFWHGFWLNLPSSPLVKNALMQLL